MAECQGRYTNDCTGIATATVNFGGVGDDGMPSQGTSMLLCQPCVDYFTGYLVEAGEPISVTPLDAEMNLSVRREIGNQ